MLSSDGDGIVSKRLGSRDRSGPSPDWLKFMNPAAPAMKRQPEGGWRVDDGIYGTAFRAASQRRLGSLSPVFARSMMIRRSGRLNVCPGMQGRDDGLASNPHETGGLGIKSVTVQKRSDWHGGQKSSQNFLP
jgi:hypothetical protein